VPLQEIEKGNTDKVVSALKRLQKQFHPTYSFSSAKATKTWNSSEGSSSRFAMARSFMGRKKKHKSSKGPEPIDHARFLQLLTDAFPEVPQAFDEYSIGLLHCEMGVFARLTEAAIDEGRLWRVEQYFRFIERVRETATPEVENAVDVSYIESLAFSEVTDNRRSAFKLMPLALKAILLEIDGRGRWA
jgi:hypothetical protein